MRRLNTHGYVKFRRRNRELTVMGEYGELRAMSRAALLDFDQAAERSIGRLFVLATSNGDVRRG